ncbi:MAG: ADP-ribosylglycohydrolase family protein [Rhodospirillales bacterium]
MTSTIAVRAPAAESWEGVRRLPSFHRSDSGAAQWYDGRSTGFRFLVTSKNLFLDDADRGRFRVTHLARPGSTGVTWLSCRAVDEQTVSLSNPREPARQLTIRDGDLHGDLPGDETYTFMLEAWSNDTEVRNRMLLEGLIAQGRISVSPSGIPTYTGIRWHDGLADRVDGMLLGLAIGDALGNTSEGLDPARRRELHGEIRDYLPNSSAQGRPVGVPTDDTQLSFWTVESLLEEGRLDPDALARKFGASRVHGIGQTMERFLAANGAGVPWPEAAPRSAGNGALMRIAPVILPHLLTSGETFHADAIICAALTHNDPASISSCLAFARMLVDLAGMDGPPEPGWWPVAFIRYARPVEGEETSYSLRQGPHAGRFTGPLWRFVEERLVGDAQRYPDLPSGVADWSSGSYLLETVPSVLLTLMRHADDPEEAIIRAVNDTRDNDTIASIVGAAVGALHGGDALPARWKDGLSGRVRSSDDGSVPRLIKAAVDRWVNSA